jgi:acetyl esterase/lipase
VILIHGGGWSSGSKEDFSDAGKILAEQGYVAFSINYRLATVDRNHWPAQLDDAQRSMRWIRAHAKEYGIDPQHIGVLGHSAGGHLAICLGTRDTRDNSDALLASYSSRATCVIDMSGPADLVLRENSLGDGIVYSLLGGTTAQLPTLARDASPLYNVDAKSSPVLIFHGRLDELVPPQQAERLDAALRKAGVESKLVIMDDEGHSYLKKANADRVIQQSLEFLKQHLHPGALPPP